MKKFDISSDKPVEDEEDIQKTKKRKREESEDVDELIAGTMRNMVADQDRKYVLQSEKVRLETERGNREAEEAERKRVIHLEDLRDRKWKAYLESLKYTDDEFARRRTEKLKRELEELERF